MDTFLDESFNNDVLDVGMSFSQEFSLNSLTHDFDVAENLNFDHEPFSAFNTGVYEEMDISDRNDSGYPRSSAVEDGFGNQGPPVLVEDEDVMELEEDFKEEQLVVPLPSFYFNPQPIQPPFASRPSVIVPIQIPFASRPSVIVSIPKDRLQPQSIITDNVYRHKRRAVAADFDAPNDSIIVRNYLIRSGLHNDLCDMSPAVQSPFITAAIEYCFFDLGWEQVRIRLVLQYIFGMKENNAKSRVCKVIKNRKKEMSEPRGVKRKVNNIKDESVLSFDDDTDVEPPPLKKSRCDLNNLGMD